jgi:hypothetical protein
MEVVRFYLLSLFFRTRTAKNSGGAAGVLLLFRLPELSQPRISAELETSLADNSWKNSEKQRDAGRAAATIPTSRAIAAARSRLRFRFRSCAATPDAPSSGRNVSQSGEIRAGTRGQAAIAAKCPRAA